MKVRSSTSTKIQETRAEASKSGRRPLFADRNRYRTHDLLKRGFDVALAVVLLTILLPLMVLIGILIKLSSPGPMLFTQRRLTAGGRVFTMYKFRTMCANAESKTGAVMAAANDMRVTRLGRILRKSRFDELPQLVNVIIGDMSLIGPRPERPEIAKELVRQLPEMRERLSVAAGLTGLAQVKAGYVSSAEEYKEKLAWDMQYIKKRSLLLDLKIAWLTIWVIITGRGAR